jgi:putative SOS response-associated peptidase YedK
VDPLDLARRPGRPSCTIVTCPANELVRPIHDRIPVVFADPEFWRAWLHPSLDSRAARDLLAPLPAEGMVVRPASPALANKRSTDLPI